MGCQLTLEILSLERTSKEKSAKEYCIQGEQKSKCCIKSWCTRESPAKSQQITGTTSLEEADDKDCATPTGGKAVLGSSPPSL